MTSRGPERRAVVSQNDAGTAHLRGCPGVRDSSSCGVSAGIGGLQCPRFEPAWLTEMRAAIDRDNQAVKQGGPGAIIIVQDRPADAENQDKAAKAAKAAVINAPVRPAKRSRNRSRYKRYPIDDTRHSHDTGAS